MESNYGMGASSEGDLTDVAYSYWSCSDPEASCRVCGALDGVEWVPEAGAPAMAPHPACESDECTCCVVEVHVGEQGAIEHADQIRARGGRSKWIG